MADAGRGTILGVTSGAGWRAADAGAYSCAKRAVAALTWQLGRVAPPGSRSTPCRRSRRPGWWRPPLERARGRAPGAASGGLSLDSMPSPAGAGTDRRPSGQWDPPTCRGQVIFVGGSEVAVIDRPRLLEVFRTETRLLDLAPARDGDRRVRSGRSRPGHRGGSNPRFGTLFDAAGAAPGAGDGRPPMCGGVRSARAGWRAERIARRTRMGLRTSVGRWRRRPRCRGLRRRRAEALTETAERTGPFDAVVVALAGSAAAADDGGRVGKRCWPPTPRSRLGSAPTPRGRGRRPTTRRRTTGRSGWSPSPTPPTRAAAAGPRPRLSCRVPPDRRRKGGSPPSP